MRWYFRSFWNDWGNEITFSPLWMASLVLSYEGEFTTFEVAFRLYYHISDFHGSLLFRTSDSQTSRARLAPQQPSHCSCRTHWAQPAPLCASVPCRRT